MKQTSYRLEPLVWLLALVLLTGAIFFESTQAPTIDDSIIPHLDKIAHVGAFGLMAFLLLRVTHAMGRAIRWPVLLGVAVSTIAIGMLDEWLQSTVSGRMASGADVLADIVGVLGYIGACVLRGLRH